MLLSCPVSTAREWLIRSGRGDILENVSSQIGENGAGIRWLSENALGFRASSLSHDKLVGVIERAWGMEDTWYGTAFTVGSIPPAFALQYYSLGVSSYHYNYNNLVDGG